MDSDSERDEHIRDYEAVEQPDGSWFHHLDNEIYWYNEVGQVHRVAGPAILYPDGDVSWYLYDNKYDFDVWCEFVKISDEDKMMLMLQYV
jgi:hypothetical protein